jgi:hypothetical protein
MELGFESIGNATIVCYDKVPVLATDPWLSNTAYFGSWTMSHEIPEEQRQAICRCKYAWVSHGHPDHLCVESLKQLEAEYILLPDHQGGRIQQDLETLGFKVRVLESRVWHRMSDRIRVMSIADYNQDAVLLIDVGGRLIMNFNDAGDRGWGAFVRAIARKYPVKFLLKLGGFGDADMINLFEESGARIVPRSKEREHLGEAMAIEAALWGAKFVVPFSSMHKFQRSDSIWANPYTADVEDYRTGFQSETSELLPAFIRYDCLKDSVQAINPPEKSVQMREPEEFGDNWNELLNAEDAKILQQYFGSVAHLREHFDFLNLRVGGKDCVIELSARKFNRGITFEVPRTSLMTAVQYEVFDDLLIGNFMKTTLHGQFGEERLYPHFSPYVAKYSDNGKARTHEELEAYFKAYRRRAPLDYFRHVLESGSRHAVMAILRTDSSAYRTISRLYHFIKAA